MRYCKREPQAVTDVERLWEWSFGLPRVARMLRAHHRVIMRISGELDSFARTVTRAVRLKNAASWTIPT